MAETTQRKPIKSHSIDTKEAINIIAVAKEEALAIIATAAREAKQTVASDRTDATKLLASNAADAARVANVKGSDDHDLLTKLDTKLEILMADVKNLKNGNVPVKDFEELKLKFDIKNDKQDIKIEALEDKTSNYKIAFVLYSIAVGFMITLTLYHILHPS